MRHFMILGLIGLAATILPLHQAEADEIKIFASRVTRLALAELGPDFERRTGHKLVVTEDVAVVMQRRIQAGEAFDLAVLVDYQTDKLIESGLLEAPSRTDIMRSGTGISIRRGSPLPDIATPDKLKAALLGAHSVTYLAEGASTLHIDRVLTQLGIADLLRGTTLRVPTDTVAERVAAGKSELGIGIIANILSVPGVTLVGPFPPPLQFDIVFTAAVSAKSPNQQAARDVIALLTGPAGQAAIRARGMQPG